MQSRNGRALAMVTHPERTVLGGTGSRLGERMRGERVGAWVGLFKGVREWVSWIFCHKSLGCMMGFIYD